jgi:hypothetical protein
VQTLALFNPFAHTVAAARALVNGQLGNEAILLGFGLVAGLAVFWATRIFRQATA